MWNVLLVTLNGLTLGALYFLVASGLSLIFGLMRVITMAHGMSYLLGGYLAYKVAKSTGSWILGAAAASVLIGLLGLLIHQVLIRRFQNDDLRVALITLGVALIGTDLMFYYFGGTALQVPTSGFMQSSVSLPGIGDYPVMRLVVLAVAIVIGVGLHLVIARTRAGAVVRAGVDDARMAGAIGVNTRIVFATVFFLGSALAGFAGAAGGALFPLLPGQDGTFLLFSLVVVIVGGMGSIAGAALGAALVGVVSQFALVYAPTYALVITFGLMVVVLAFKPTGLLGRAA